MLGSDTRLMAMDSLLFIPRGSSGTSIFLCGKSYTSFKALVTMDSRFSGAIPLILAKKSK